MALMSHRRSGLRIPTLVPQDRKNANHLRSSGRYGTLTVVDLADKPGPSAPKIIPKCMIINSRSLAKPDAAWPFMQSSTLIILISALSLRRASITGFLRTWCVPVDIFF